MKAQHIQTGQIGEEVAWQFLSAQGFTLLERNHRQKWGEIDLIVLRDITVHFVEVKTVSHETKSAIKTSRQAGYRPEEQVTKGKHQRLARTIETWLAQEGYKGHYQLDLVTVHVVPHETYALVEYYENIVVD
ncbi:MAG TPA: YraN family protein [Candidatus Paceibacterota bacterium]|nr:YraN family protein [Candidatus Paceibacterota bacterium]